jgi:hypothetical protein
MRPKSLPFGIALAATIIVGYLAITFFSSAVETIKFDRYLEEKQTKKAELKAKLFQKPQDEDEENGDDKNEKTQATLSSHSSRQLLGNHKLHIFFVSNPGGASKFASLIDQLSTPDASNPNTFAFIEPWFQAQSRQYSKADFDIELDIHSDPLTLSKEAYLGDLANPWGKDNFAIVNFQDKFDELIIDVQHDVAPEDMVMFIYLDSGGYNPNGSAHSYFDYLLFRSFADESRGRAYVNAFDTSPSSGELVVNTTAHELLHLFGATDKYVEGKPECSEAATKGLNASDYLVKNRVDIMCGLLETTDGPKRATFSKDTLVIYPLTATEIGWLK